jgi:hypothetical protein
MKKRPFIVEKKNRGKTGAQIQLQAAWNEMHLDTPERKGRFAVAAKEERSCDGVTFDSRKQMLRYTQLKILLRARQISNLELEPRWNIEINGQKVCTYTADFSYFCHERNRAVIEDVKSTGTAKDPYFRLRKRLAEASFGIRIEEILL